MGTKKGQVRKTARRAYEGKGPRRDTSPKPATRSDKYGRALNPIFDLGNRGKLFIRVKQKDKSFIEYPFRIRRLK